MRCQRVPFPPLFVGIPGLVCLFFFATLLIFPGRINDIAIPLFRRIRRIRVGVLALLVVWFPFSQNFLIRRLVISPSMYYGYSPRSFLALGRDAVVIDAPYS